MKDVSQSKVSQKFKGVVISSSFAKGDSWKGN